MKRKDRSSKETSPSDVWFVYVLRCVDGSLYTGITNNVNRRCRQHHAGTASRYTRSRLPVELVYQEVHVSRGAALKREAAIKALPRKQKDLIIFAGLKKPQHEVDAP